MEEDEDRTVLGLLSKFTETSDEVWKYLVAPPRYEYSQESLGPELQIFRECNYNRINDEFINERGDRVEYTFYHADDPKNRGQCVLYLHSHGGSRLEGSPQLEYCAEKGLNLCLIDFAGSGLSGGEYISLGWFERYDVRNLIMILEAKHAVTGIILWGRSMGAATAMLTNALQSMTLPIDMIILDSPFMNLKKVYQRCVKKVISLPNLFIDMIYQYAKRKIKRNVGFDISKVRPVDVSDNVRCPVIFIGSHEDELVDYKDMKKLFTKFKTSKKIFVGNFF